ncbi:MAG: GNAT family N-acetyltransferase [Bacteroidota bacterium]
MQIRFTTKAFEDLHLHELYELLKLRQAIFVVEQNCPYLDADDKDQIAQHLLGYAGKELLAYARILPRGISYPDCASIGRVIVATAARGKKQGHILMQHAIATTQKLYPETPIKISAQAHLQKFYERLGFRATGEAYLEDNIPHIGMLLS